MDCNVIYYTRNHAFKQLARGSYMTETATDNRESKPETSRDFQPFQIVSLATRFQLPHTSIKSNRKALMRRMFRCPYKVSLRSNTVSRRRQKLVKKCWLPSWGNYVGITMYSYPNIVSKNRVGRSENILCEIIFFKFLEFFLTTAIMFCYENLENMASNSAWKTILCDHMSSIVDYNQKR